MRRAVLQRPVHSLFGGMSRESNPLKESVDLCVNRAICPSSNPSFATTPAVVNCGRPLLFDKRAACLNICVEALCCRADNRVKESCLETL